MMRSVTSRLPWKQSWLSRQCVTLERNLSHVSIYHVTGHVTAHVTTHVIGTLSVFVTHVSRHTGVTPARYTGS